MYEALAAAHRAYHQHWRGRARLAGKTLSVGNITWGGTGKTQFVCWLLDQQPKHSTSAAAVLTRGYGGGDEARLYWSKGFVCGMGKDRVKASQALLAKTTPIITHWVLDDGLQHWRLYRDVDVVMVDCLKPFGSTGYVIPFGSLRESPKRGLGRADCIVLHNANLVDRATRSALRQRVREFASSSSSSPPIVIFSESVVDDDASVGVSAATTVAFAGIGNNEAFFQLVRRQQQQTPHCVSFRDHHYLTPKEIDDLAAMRADKYLTTEKDLARQPELAGAPLFAKPVRVRWSPMKEGDDDDDDDGDLDRFHKLVRDFFN